MKKKGFKGMETHGLRATVGGGARLKDVQRNSWTSWNSIYWNFMKFTSFSFHLKGIDLEKIT